MIIRYCKAQFSDQGYRPEVILSDNPIDLSEVQVLFSSKNNARHVEDIPGVGVIHSKQESLIRDKGLSFETSYLENLDRGVFGE